MEKIALFAKFLNILDIEVVKLDRMEYAGLTKRGLLVGDWRYLTYDEVEKLEQWRLE